MAINRSGGVSTGKLSRHFNSRAKIHGQLDLSWAKISFRLSMRQCVFDDTLLLGCSHLSSLYLSKSVIKDLIADGLLVEGDVYPNFRSQGEASLKNAHVGGILDSSKSEFNSRSERGCLEFDRAEIKGSVYLNDIKSQGMVILTEAKIGGILNCINGKFNSHCQGGALDLHGIKTDGTVYLADGFEARGTVSLVDAQIGGIPCYLPIGKAGCVETRSVSVNAIRADSATRR